MHGREKKKEYIRLCSKNVSHHCLPLSSILEKGSHYLTLFGLELRM